MVAAARLLAARRPAAAARTLLEFAPFADARDMTKPRLSNAAKRGENGGPFQRFLSLSRGRVVSWWLSFLASGALGSVPKQPLACLMRVRNLRYTSCAS
jgi:hypothetical protein